METIFEKRYCKELKYIGRYETDWLLSYNIQREWALQREKIKYNVEIMTVMNRKSIIITMSAPVLLSKVHELLCKILRYECLFDGRFFKMQKYEIDNLDITAEMRKSMLSYYEGEKAYTKFSQPMNDTIYKRGFCAWERFNKKLLSMSTADSLLQRMGRCNRKGRYIPDKANIHIYINANGVGVSRAIYNREIYTRSVECLEKYIGRVMTESDKSEYINKVYCTDEIKDTDYYRDIEKFLAMFKELTPAEYSKSEADEKFRDINSIKIIPDDVYEDNREVISECIDIMHSSNADRREKNDARTKLDSYVISIQLYAYKKYPDGIDRDVIYGSDIHRSCIMYDFNVVDLTGAGLVLGEYERDIFV